MIYPVLYVIFLSLKFSKAGLEGFAVTTSKNWVKHEDGIVSISKFCKTSHFDSVSVRILVTPQESTHAYHDATDLLHDVDDKIYKVSLPPEAEDKLNLTVQIKSSDGSYQFMKSAKIDLILPTNFVFIQTDKPFYKPSDRVRTRVLVLSGRNFKPLTDYITEAYVTDSLGTRVAQWSNPSSKSGIYDFELPLSSEPRLGWWNFVAITKDGREKRSFKVEKYVLPKFSVTIQNDLPYISLYDSIEEKILYKVCAKYTYGKPVTGEVSLDDNHSKPRQLKNDGCAAFNVSYNSLFQKGDLFVRATVTEKGTGVSKSAELNTPVYGIIKVKVSTFCNNYIKPGIEYRCRAQAFYSDDVPAKNVSITIRDINRKTSVEVVTDEHGLLEIVVPAVMSENISYTVISVEPQRPPSRPKFHFYGYYDHYGQRGLFLKRWVSPSSIYLDILKTNDKSEQVDTDPFNLTFQIVSKKELPDEKIMFRYMVYSSGKLFRVGNFSYIPNLESSIESENVNATGSELFHRYKNSILLDLQEVQGHVKMLLYFHTSDGMEIVSDVTNFWAPKKWQNQVSMKFSSSRLQPGLETNLHIKSSGQSLCSVGVLDKSLELLKDVEYLTYEKVEYHLAHYGQPTDMNGYSDEPEICPPNDTETELIFKNWDPHGRQSYIASKDIFEMQGDVLLSDFEISREFCLPFEFVRMMVYDSSFSQVGRGPIAMSSQVPKHRDFFPETWIWDLIEINDNEEEKIIPVNLPHTITEWSGNGFCIGKETGLGISPRFSIIGFQPFFLSFNLPYSIIRGERAVIPISITSYLPDCITVNLNLSQSDYLDIPVLKQNDFTLCHQGTKVINVTIIAKQIGKVNFTVVAKSQSLSPLQTNSIYDENEINVQDSVTYSILVEPEGKPVEVVDSAFVCAPASGIFTLKPPEQKVVKDSRRSFISVSGDLMASTLANMEDLLALPTGCGEQNMVKFVPNIYVLDYLDKSGLLAKNIREKALHYLTVGYQRELQYRRTDGSFSAFGNSDPEGSLWLTAFVVKSFASAKNHIFIDQSNLDVSIKFITLNQMESGCFPLIGRLFQKDLMGNMQNDETQSTFAYNAYIVSSLVEAGLSLDDEFIKKGYNCLKARLDSSSENSIYDKVLLLHALSLVSDHDELYQETFKKLLVEVNAASAGGNGVNWDLDESNPAAAVEMTSYVMLSLLENKNQPDSTKLLKMASWLSEKRSSKGGFYSTQDTVMALKALSRYASFFSDLSDVTVSFPNVMTIEPIVVNTSNKLLLQKFENVYLSFKPIKYSIRGKGCAVIQVGTKMNLATFSGDQHQISVFNMSVGIKASKVSCKERSLHICFVYNGDAESTNMAVLSVKLPTGWEADAESLDDIYRVTNLKRHDIDRDHVQFYFDEVTKLETCLHFKLVQSTVVLKGKPAMVKIYDYYNPDIAASAEYVIPQHCALASQQVPKQIKLVPNVEYLRILTSEIDVANQEGPFNCPSCTDSPTSSQIKQACDNTYNFKVQENDMEWFGLISSNLPRNITVKKVKILLPAGCSCIYNSIGSKQRIIINFDGPIELDSSSLNITLALKETDSLFTISPALVQQNILNLASEDLKPELCN